MTTTTNPHLPPPAGAVWVDDEWGDQGTPDESRYFNHQKIPVEGTVLMIVGVQHARRTSGRSISLHTEQSTADVSVDLTPGCALNCPDYEDVMIGHHELASEVATIVGQTSWVTLQALARATSARGKTLDTLVQKLNRTTYKLDRITDLAGVAAGDLGAVQGQSALPLHIGDVLHRTDHDAQVARHWWAELCDLRKPMVRSRTFILKSYDHDGRDTAWPGLISLVIDAHMVVVIRFAPMCRLHIR